MVFPDLDVSRKKKVQRADDDCRRSLKSDALAEEVAAVGRIGHDDLGARAVPQFVGLSCIARSNENERWGVQASTCLDVSNPYFGG